MNFKYYFCANCRGFCIFADSFPKKYEKSEIMRKMVKEKYFKKEFGLIRFYLNEVSTSNEDEEVEPHQGFELIKKFHTLSKKQKDEVLKLHGNRFSLSNLHFHCQTNKCTKIKKLCFTCSHPKEFIFPIVPRNAKRQEMLKEQMNDIFLTE